MLAGMALSLLPSLLPAACMQEVMLAGMALSLLPSLLLFFFREQQAAPSGQATPTTPTSTSGYGTAPSGAAVGGMQQPLLADDWCSEASGSQQVSCLTLPYWL